MAKHFDILVMGATGFTGRLITRYLFSHPQFRTDFTFAIGGRSRARLDELAQELSLDDTVPSLQLDLADFDALQDGIKQVKVVINTVGPYWRWGTPVVRACVENGVHYVDLCGEPVWIKDIIDEFHLPASQKGAIIVHACAFDSIPSEIVAFLSNKTLKDISPEAELGECVTAVDVGGSLSGGTLNTMFASIEEVPKDKLQAAGKDYSLSPVKGLPSAGLKLTYSLPVLKPVVYGGFWFMKPTNRTMVQRTWGLLQQEKESTASTQARRLAYGPEFRYEEFLQCSGPVSSIFTSLALLAGLICVATFAPVRRLIAKWAPPGTGPSEERMRKGYVTLTNISLSSNLPNQVAVKTVLRGRGDPGYLLTSIMISESALSILLSHDSLPPLGKKGGVLMPMAAFGDTLIQRLEKRGHLSFEQNEPPSRSTTRWRDLLSGSEFKFPLVVFLSSHHMIIPPSHVALSRSGRTQKNGRTFAPEKTTNHVHIHDLVLKTMTTATNAPDTNVRRATRGCQPPMRL